MTALSPERACRSQELRGHPFAFPVVEVHRLDIILQKMADPQLTAIVSHRGENIRAPVGERHDAPLSVRQFVDGPDGTQWSVSNRRRQLLTARHDDWSTTPQQPNEWPTGRCRLKRVARRSVSSCSRSCRWPPRSMVARRECRHVGDVLDRGHTGVLEAVDRHTTWRAESAGVDELRPTAVDAEHFGVATGGQCRSDDPSHVRGREHADGGSAA